MIGGENGNKLTALGTPKETPSRKLTAQGRRLRRLRRVIGTKPTTPVTELDGQTELFSEE
jgi:hypothetical protein